MRRRRRRRRRRRGRQRRRREGRRERRRRRRRRKPRKETQFCWCSLKTGTLVKTYSIQLWQQTHQKYYVYAFILWGAISLLVSSMTQPPPILQSLLASPFSTYALFQYIYIYMYIYIYIYMCVHICVCARARSYWITCFFLSFSPIYLYCKTYFWLKSSRVSQNVLSGPLSGVLSLFIVLVSSFVH